MLKKFLHALLNWFLPRTCCLCNSLAQVYANYQGASQLLDLCGKCLARINYSTNCCFQCAKRLSTKGDENLRCHACQDFNPVIYQTIAACSYGRTVSRLLNGLRFGDRRYIAPILAFLLAQKLLNQECEKPQVLIPVPLHPRKLRARGYNQALEIAIYLGHYLNLPVKADLCYRIKDTCEQRRLSKHQRFLNMAGAFAITKAVYQYQHIAIIDDLVVSGATVRSLALELAKTSIERIDVWCVCRV